MMTKKTMTILSVFMIVALTAVGFAAWLIVGTIDAETQGSFVSNELKDQFFKVEVEFNTDVDEKNGQIIFGRPTTSSTDDYWLTYKEEDAQAKLSATATIKFIPDKGFSKVSGQEKDMAFYLLDSEDDTTKYYRTVRVAIDIEEVFGDNGEQETDNFKWFDMAVELGYIEYPTAKWLTHDSVAKQDTDLVWTKNEGVETNLGNFDKFEKGYLYIDLTYDMFEIQYPEDSDIATEATAKIQIDFKWGTAVGGQNPYDYFNALEPEETTTVDSYLKSTISGETINYALDATTDAQDNVEGNEKTIRYKDLAQRMLDYLYGNLNYVPADTEKGTEASGLQFSVSLIEGALDQEAKPVNP